MDNREKELLAIRPEIPTIDEQKAYSFAEKFQNTTLRPILKYQNQLLLAIFEAELVAKKVQLARLPHKERETTIKALIIKNASLKQLLLGTVIGLFSVQELAMFRSEEKELNRRTIQMIIQRLQSQIDILIERAL